MDSVGLVIEFFFFAKANRSESLRVFLRHETWMTEQELFLELLREPYGVIYVESQVTGVADPGHIALKDVMYHSVPTPVTDSEAVRTLPRLRTLPLID